MNSGRLFSLKRIVAYMGALPVVGVPVSAFSQTSSDIVINTDMAMSSAPLIIGGGALVFGIATVFWLLRTKKSSVGTHHKSQTQVAQLRADLDEYQAILACMPEVTILWQQAGNPQMFGEPEIFGAYNTGLVELLNYEGWLLPTDAIKLATGVKHLHGSGQEFSISIRTKTGQLVRAVGRAAGDATIVRLRSATALPPQSAISQNNHPENSTISALSADASKETLQDANTILSLISEPAWVRTSTGEIMYANEAYLALCKKLNIEKSGEQLPEIFSSNQIQQHLSALQNTNTNGVISNLQPDMPENVELKMSPFSSGSINILAPKNYKSDQNLAQNAGAPDSVFSNFTQVMDAMANPIAVFDKEARLTQFNSAYVELFSFENNWLSVGLNEREIIDYLRRRDLLPAVSDYRQWRTEHLKAYKSDQPLSQTWHLRDGRTLEVVATPDKKTGGVIYTFSDVTEQLRLQSSNKAMLSVQRETLNALSEGVAVFGTNGRLRLHNPRLSQIWKLPMNELGQNPHIDKIAAACGKSVPEDGEEIWQKLKLSVIDLDPGRQDKKGRIKRADGTLIDYTIVRLGDSQTMLTFVDVTQSANYEYVLKERNDALVTADRLKDAFVQNVSYELRSPLTSIIGFADLLASDNIGPLTEQQRSYTDYIRSSSATLGVLIDNILDLTNVDAGIAQLDLNEQNIAELIEKAKAGFSATLVKSDGATPLNLVVSLPDPQPRFVADGARVVQILYNLLSNAAKFSEPGAVINLDVEANSEWVRFVLRDQGVGIPEELQEAISHSDRELSLKGLQRGAGIGLLIVKAFVELHHGTLSMQPSGQGGSQIVVTLPADASALIEHSV